MEYVFDPVYHYILSMTEFLPLLFSIFRVCLSCKVVKTQSTTRTVSSLYVIKHSLSHISHTQRLLVISNMTESLDIYHNLSLAQKVFPSLHHMLSSIYQLFMFWFCSLFVYLLFSYFGLMCFYIWCLMLDSEFWLPILTVCIYTLHVVQAEQSKTLNRVDFGISYQFCLITIASAINQTQ